MDERGSHKETDVSKPQHEATVDDKNAEEINASLIH